MNTYSTSTGERVSKSTIDSRVKVAKQKLLDEQTLEFGYNFCVECKKSSGVYLDCAHDISVKECQESGLAELAWDVKNMKVKCRDCHQEQDGLKLKFQYEKSNENTMRRLKYKTSKLNGKTVSITKCDRDILIGTRDCMGCSYCCEHKPWDKVVMCRKKRGGNHSAPPT